MSSVAGSWRRMEAVLWENAHSLFKSLRKPASEAQIARLAKLIPAKLPRDFVQSLRIHDGLRDSHLGPNRLFNYNALLPISAMIVERQMLSDLQEEFEFPGGRAGDDARVRNDARWRPGWIPVMDADGDKLILDLDPAPSGSMGQVFKWSNYGSMPLRVLAPTFGEWLSELAATLEARRFRLDAHGGIWLGDRLPGE